MLTNFQYGNKTYTNTKYFTKSYSRSDYIVDNQYIFYLNNTNLGISDDSLSIVDEGDNLSFRTHLIVENSETIKDSTYVELYLKINNNTLQSSYDTAINIADKCFLAIGSFETDGNNTSALVQYNISNNYLVGFSILDSGSFLSSEKNVEINKNNIKTIIDDSISNTEFIKQWLTPIISIDIINPELSDFPLGTVFNIARKNASFDSILGPEFDAEIQTRFMLNDYTIEIDGGVNYAVGDVFVVDDGNASTPGTIEVTEVNSTGSITKTTVTEYGMGFTTTPSITYTGSTGTSASITVYDIYQVSLQVLNGGNGYSSYDFIKATYPDETSVTYDPYNTWEDTLTTSPRDPTFVINTYPILLDPIIYDKFSISSVNIVDPGFNHKNNPIVKLVNLNNNQLLDNTFITSNNNNFINLSTTP